MNVDVDELRNQVRLLTDRSEIWDRMQRYARLIHFTARCCVGLP